MSSRNIITVAACLLSVILFPLACSDKGGGVVEIGLPPFETPGGGTGTVTMEGSSFRCPTSNDSLGKETLSLLPVQCDIVASGNPAVLGSPPIKEAANRMAKNWEPIERKMLNSYAGATAEVSGCAIINSDNDPNADKIKSFIVVAKAIAGSNYLKITEGIIPDLSNEGDKEVFNSVVTNQIYEFEDNTAIFSNGNIIAYGSADLVGMVKDGKTANPMDEALAKNWEGSKAGHIKIASNIPIARLPKDARLEIEESLKNIGLPTTNAGLIGGFDAGTMCLEAAVIKDGEELARNVTKASPALLKDVRYGKLFDSVTEIINEIGNNAQTGKPPADKIGGPQGENVPPEQPNPEELIRQCEALKAKHPFCFQVNLELTPDQTRTCEDIDKTNPGCRQQ